MKPSLIHDQAYEFCSWQQLGDDIFQVAKQIIDDGYECDRIIALAKGGLTFSRSLVDYLGVKEISSIQIEFYTGIGTTAGTPVITQSLPVSIKNQKILIVDDLVDKGETMKMATQYLKYHGAAEIKTAVLIRKPWTTFEPDFYCRESTAWVIFPNEIRETIETLVGLWQKRGDSPQEIAAQLEKVGFPSQEVALFAKLQ